LNLGEQAKIQPLLLSITTWTFES